MTSTRIAGNERTRRAFSLFDVPQILCFCFVLAALVAMPSLWMIRESNKVGSAIRFLESVHHAQQSYCQRHGYFADELSKLDIDMITPAYFQVEPFENAGGQNASSSWSLTLTRCGGQLLAYDPYTITFNDTGIDWHASSIDPGLLADSL